MIAHYYDCSHIEHVCTLYFVHIWFDTILGLLNLDIITSTPPLECLHCLFVCNLQFKPISFLYIQTLHNDCSLTEDVHRRRRSRAEFGLVFRPIRHRKSNVSITLRGWCSYLYEIFLYKSKWLFYHGDWNLWLYCCMNHLYISQRSL